MNCKHCRDEIENLGNAETPHWVHISSDPRAPIGSAQCVGDYWGEIAAPADETAVPTVRVRIVEDRESSAFDNGEDAATIEAFERGDLSYLGVVVERLNPQCQACNRGPSWEVVDSLWAIDLLTDDPALPYLWKHAGASPPFVLPADEAREIPGYLGEIVREMLPV